jgi:POT family proton-dependent oligopeptide transporter
MSVTPPIVQQPIPSPAGGSSKTLLGHPIGLFLLFLVEMWERFSYYGMRGLLVLYLTCPNSGMAEPPPGKHAGFNPGPGWSDASASTLYGWYAGMAYLTPILGGIIADKLIGTHRSMLVGAIVIASGHVALALSGLPGLHATPAGMSVFIFGLVLIVLGTGHFKPSVSVMVGQLYPAGDPRRDSAFSIFYMGINLGAFLCNIVCGLLAYRVGWHWGFGAAAIGMLAGLALYMFCRPRYLRNIGDPPPGKGSAAPVFIVGAFALSAAFAAFFHFDGFGKLGEATSSLSKGIGVWMLPAVVFVGALITAGWCALSLKKKAPEDRLPMGAIGAAAAAMVAVPIVVWFLGVQAGPTLTGVSTNPDLAYGATLGSLPNDAHGVAMAAFGLAVAALFMNLALWFSLGQKHGDRGPTATIFIFMAFNAFFWIAFEQAGSSVNLFTDRYADRSFMGGQIDTPLFQSVNPLLIIIGAPLFAVLWGFLGKRRMNPSQPIKIALGLLFLAFGYVFIWFGARQVSVAPDGVTVLAKTSMLFVVAMYFWHTVGELCLSPTGLSYVTKAAPVRFVSLLMGIWFISSFIANLGGGLLAAQVKNIESGALKLPWHFGGQADFFFLFVVSSTGAAVLILVLTPFLKKLMRSATD